jgi:uncharacterized protein (TIGR02611 family)
MFEKIKKSLKKMSAGVPGRRFQDRYHRKHTAGNSSFLRKVMLLGGGSLISAAGIFFLPAPGPGFVIIFIGAGMMAQESLMIAKFLDATELKGRRAARWGKATWKKMSAAARVSLIVTSAAVAGALAWVAWTTVIR